MRPKNPDRVIDVLADLHRQGRGIDTSVIEEVARTGKASRQLGFGKKAALSATGAAIGVGAVGSTAYAGETDAPFVGVELAVDDAGNGTDGSSKDSSSYTEQVDIDLDQVEIDTTPYQWGETSGNTDQTVDDEPQGFVTIRGGRSSIDEGIIGDNGAADSRESKWLTDSGDDTMTVITLDSVLSSSGSGRTDSEIEALSDAVTEVRKATMRPDGSYHRVVIAEATERSLSNEEADRVNALVRASASDLNIDVVEWKVTSGNNPEYFDSSTTTQLAPAGALALQGLARQSVEQTSVSSEQEPSSPAQPSVQSPSQPVAAIRITDEASDAAVEVVDYTAEVDNASETEQNAIFDEPIEPVSSPEDSSSSHKESIYLSGDSLLVGLEGQALQEALESEGFEVLDIDAKGGKRFTYGIKTAQSPENVQHVREADVIFFAYGTNDSLDQVIEDTPLAIRTLHQMGSEDGRAPLIVIPAIIGDNPRVRAKEKVAALESIVAAARAEGINVVLYRRDTEMAESGLDQFIAEDDIHLTGEGSKELAKQEAEDLADMVHGAEPNALAPTQEPENPAGIATVSVDEPLDETFFDLPQAEAAPPETPPEGPQVAAPEVQASSSVPSYELSADGQTINIDNIVKFVLEQTTLHESGNACMINPFTIDGLPSHAFTRWNEQRERLGRPEHIAYAIAEAQILQHLINTEFPQYKGAILGVSDIHSGNPHIEHTEDRPAIDLTSVFAIDVDNEFVQAKAGDPGPVYVTGSDHFNVELTARLIEEAHKIHYQGFGVDDYIIIRQQTGLEERLANVNRHDNNTANIFTRKPVWDHDDHIHKALRFYGQPMWANIYDPSNCDDVWDEPLSEVTIPEVTAPSVEPESNDGVDIIDEYVEIIEVPFDAVTVVLGDIDVSLPDISTPSVDDVIDFVGDIVDVVDDGPEESPPVTQRDGPVINPESSSNVDTAPYSELLSFIASSEGGYNSMNQGSSGGRIQGSTHDASEILGLDLTQMTVAQVMEFQKSGALYAAGRYQIIPVTMPGAVASANVDPSELFTPEVQDRLGVGLLNVKREYVGQYLRGEHNDIEGAMLDLAKEWASLPDPSTGKTFYPQQGNRSSHTVEEVRNALLNARAVLTA